MSKREEIRKIVDETAKKMHGYESREAWIEDSTDMILDMLQSAGYIAEEKQQEPCPVCNGVKAGFENHTCMTYDSKPTNPTELDDPVLKCGLPNCRIKYSHRFHRSFGPDSHSWFHESCGQWHEIGPCKEPTTKETMEADRLSVIEAKLEYLLEYALSRIPSRIETLEMMAEWKKLK